MDSTQHQECKDKDNSNNNNNNNNNSNNNDTNENSTELFYTGDCITEKGNTDRNNNGNVHVSNNQSNTNANGECKANAIEIMCFGHPLLDMMACVDEKLLEEYNVIPGSVNLATEEQLPLFNRLVDVDERVQYVTGGAAMNTARFIAWLQPTLYVSYVGALGDDRFGRMLCEALSTGRVNGLFEIRHGKTTGTCACLIWEKERALLANLGAAVELSLKHIMHKEVQAHIQRAQLYYVEGFFLNTASSPQNLLHIAEHACKNDKIFCFNLNAPYLCSTYYNYVMQLLPYVNFLFGNDDDILALSKTAWPDLHNNNNSSNNIDNDNNVNNISITTKENERRRELETAALRVSQLPMQNSFKQRYVVITCGSNPTLIAHNNAVQQIPVSTLNQSEIVDFNGAGDAFVAGFLTQYLMNGNIHNSAEMGHTVAQICIRHQGATYSGKPPLINHECENKAMEHVEGVLS